jgi:hypothetical protein
MSDKPPVLLPPPVWGIWVEEEGWLRGPEGQVFADLRRDLADTAARMLVPKIARSELFDKSMLDLEPVFLAQEHARRDIEQVEADAAHQAAEAERARIQQVRDETAQAWLSGYDRRKSEQEAAEQQRKDRQLHRRAWRWLKWAIGIR